MRYFIFYIVFSTVSIFPMSSGEYHTLLTCYEREILQIFSTRMNIDPLGVGGGVEGRKLNFCLSLEYPLPVEVGKARELVVTLTEIYLQKMNAHTELAKYEKMDFPYSVSNMRLILGFKTSKDKPKDLCVAYLVKNRVIYEKEKDDLNYELVLEETYDEAKAELTKQGINISQMVEETLKKPPKGGWLKALFSKGSKIK